MPLLRCKPHLSSPVPIRLFRGRTGSGTAHVYLSWGEAREWKECSNEDNHDTRNQPRYDGRGWRRLAGTIDGGADLPIWFTGGLNESDY